MDFINTLFSIYRTAIEWLGNIAWDTVFVTLAVFMMTMKLTSKQSESQTGTYEVESKTINIYNESASGFVWVNPKAIAACRNQWQPSLMLEPFPTELRQYIRTVKLGNIREWMQSLEVRNSEDIRRAITVSVIMFKCSVPRALILFDSRTISFYDRVRCELALHPGSLEQLERFQRQAVPTYFEIHGPMLMDIATLVLGQYITKDRYPYLETFIEDVRRNGYSGRIDHDEMRSIITALAIKFELKVPADYIRHDAYTAAALKTNQKIVTEANRGLVVVR